jgi:hypothetical protein
VIVPIAIVAGVLLMASSKKKTTPNTSTSTSTPAKPAASSAKRAQVEQIIRAAAALHKVPAQVALAFAQVESALNPKAEGDLKWHEFDNGARYRALVLNNAKFATNPHRLTPQLWHSYGLFQLLAPYHCGPNEDPRVLLDPTVNADRGCKTIARLLKQTNGDIAAARLLYTGASRAADAKKAQIVASISRALDNEIGKTGIA